MRRRLLLPTLLLVILPTAALSLMAGRALRNWELILRRNLEMAADAAISEVARRMAEHKEDELGHIRLAVTDCLVRGWQAERVREVVDRATGRNGLAGRVYVFMNPWGFLHPDEAGSRTNAAGGPGRQEALVAELRRRAATADVGRTLDIALEGRLYAFAALQDRKSLYVGMEIRPEAVRELLARELAQRPRGAFRMAMADESGIAGAAAEDGVVVRDTLGGESRARPAVWSRSPGDALLAEGRLRPPFEFLRVLAVLDDPDAVQAMGRSRARLYGWGIVLLAGGVVLGTMVMIGRAASEIRIARQRSDFVVGVSHDLRTPLASLRMLAETLYLGRVPDPAKQRTFLGAIVRESDRLGQLIERVLFLVRFGQGALSYRRQVVSPDAFVSAAVQSFRARTAPLEGTSDAPTVALRAAPELPRVCVDEAAMVQVVLNLLDNAVKYSSTGPWTSAAEPRVTVSVTTRVAARRRFGRRRLWVAIAVSDRGMGIRAAEIGRLFRPYYRSKSALDRNISGVGLGLALCRHVVHAHGGWISVQSRPGEGSVFTVHLPIEEAVRRRERCRSLRLRLPMGGG